MYYKISSLFRKKRTCDFEDVQSEPDPATVERFRTMLVQNAKHSGVIPDDECCAKYGINKDTVGIIDNNKYTEEFAVNTNIRLCDVAQLKTFEDINDAFEFVSDDGVEVELTKKSKDIKYIWVQIGRGYRSNFPMISKNIKHHLMVIMISECIEKAMAEEWFAEDCPDFNFDDCVIKRWAWVRGSDEWHVAIDGFHA